MEQIFEINNEPVMLQALEVLSILGKNEEITVMAKGNSIPSAVTVAIIITENLLRNNSKIHKIMVNSEPILEMGGVVSNIKIVLRKMRCQNDLNQNVSF